MAKLAIDSASLEYVIYFGTMNTYTNIISFERRKRLNKDDDGEVTIVVRWPNTEFPLCMNSMEMAWNDVLCLRRR